MSSSRGYSVSVLLTPAYSLGFTGGLFIGVQLVSGVLMGCHYGAIDAYSWWSIVTLSRDLSAGYLCRGVHANGAALMFGAIYLHMGRVLYRGTAGRSTVWLVGVILYLLGIGTCFTGYSLVYGQMSMWAIVVICSLVTAAPFIGVELLTLVWGGSSVSTATLGRLFVVHYLLALLMLVLALLHVWLLHSVGSTGSRDLGMSPRSDRVDFMHAYVIRDVCLGIIALTLLGGVSTWYPNAMGEADNFVYADPMVTPVCICPEWYMLPYYGLVRAIPSKPLGIAGMGLAFGSLVNLGDLGYRSSTWGLANGVGLLLVLMDVVLTCKVCLLVNHGESLYMLLLTGVLGAACASMTSVDQLSAVGPRTSTITLLMLSDDQLETTRTPTIN